MPAPLAFGTELQWELSLDLLPQAKGRMSMNMAEDPRRVTVSKDVLFEHLDDEVVLLDMRGGNYFGLSPVASDLWRALAEGKTMRQARNLLLGMYDVSSATLDADLESVMNKLLEKKLISFRNEPAYRG